MKNLILIALALTVVAAFSGCAADAGAKDGQTTQSGDYEGTPGGAEQGKDAGSESGE